MIAINGMGSTIAQALLPMLPAGEHVVRFTASGVPHLAAARYLFAQGHLEGRGLRQIDRTAEAKTWAVNFTDVAASIDEILDGDSSARICVIGSESGYKGSFDMSYAGAKAALHLYVETKPTGPSQQLVAISPGVISDAGMTRRRPDKADLAKRAKAHPKGRFASAEEVARLVHFLLYEDQGYLTGTVIRMHGGGR
jgi:NAD(P)-dependent dehydrogenase (short-subunit alcohol dehydrogenase family)